MAQLGPPVDTVAAGTYADPVAEAAGTAGTTGGGCCVVVLL